MLRDPPTDLPRELLRLLAAFAAACALVTALAVGLGAAGAAEPGALARKALVPGLILAYVLLLRLAPRELPRHAAFLPAGDGPRHYALGFLGGALPLVALIAILYALGGRHHEPEMGPGRLLVKALLYVLQGFVLVLLEEGFFRGLLHRQLVRAAGTTTAVILGSAIFALGHFLRPPKALEATADHATWQAATRALEGLATAPARWPEVFGLFLVGLVLAIMRVRAGTVWLGMGVHAGWFWVRSLDGKIVEETESFVRGRELLIGSERFYDGVAGWCALLATIPLVLLLVRRRPEAPGLSARPGSSPGSS